MQGDNKCRMCAICLKRKSDFFFLFCYVFQLTRWITKDTSNLAWQILDKNTKIPRLFAESLL